MPIVGFWCSSCEEVVDEAHYVPWSECKSGITPGHISNILSHADGRPKSGWSVTEIKGCLPAKVIERTEDVIVDPADYLKMELGTAWDAHITRHDGDKIRWHGTLDDLEISGEADGWVAWTGDVPKSHTQIIWDFKNGTPPRSGVWPDHRWQVSMYAFLSPYTFDHGYIYYNSYGGKAGEVVKRKCTLIRSEDKLLDYQLYKGYTVRDNIETMTRIVNESPEVPEFVPASDYPLTGKNISMGRDKVLCDFCVVRDKCAELECEIET